MKQKIILNQDYTLAQLKKEIENGGRFVVFQYCISILFAVTLQRLSSPIFITKEEDDKKLINKYNWISRIFGWWGIPWGPIYTTKSLAINNKGGIDVTEDIMLNLNEESLKSREVDMIMLSEIFEKPGKWDLKAFNKSIAADFESNINYKEIVVGLFINTEEGVEPHYVIGLKTNKTFDIAVQEIEESLFKQFRKHTYFEFTDLTKTDDFNSLLLKQGLRIK